MLVKIFSYLAVFCFGRMSYLVMRNKYLEEKKKELISYHSQLLALSENLEKKDDAIRHKWQSMVIDISKYQAMIIPNNGKWTDLDDQYLSSWGSAEK